jgi:hypothetical protein
MSYWHMSNVYKLEYFYIKFLTKHWLQMWLDNQTTYLWIEASAAMLMSSAVFWDIMHHRKAIFYWCFATTYSHLQRSRSPRRIASWQRNTWLYRGRCGWTMLCVWEPAERNGTAWEEEGTKHKAGCLEENGSWELSHWKVPDSESFGKYATDPDQSACIPLITKL